MTQRVTLLDGGFSTQLVNYTGEIIDGDPLWTSRFLVTDQEKCVYTHRDFVKGRYHEEKEKDRCRQCNEDRLSDTYYVTAQHNRLYKYNLPTNLTELLGDNETVIIRLLQFLKETNIFDTI